MFNVIRIVALGLWVGALAGFAFFFAPIAFHDVGPTAAFAATIAACVVALARAGWFLGALAIGATYLDRNAPAKSSLAITAGVALAIAFSVAEVVAIVPQMRHTPLGTAAYDALHRTSSTVYGVALLCALAAFVVASWRPTYR